MFKLARLHFAGLFLALVGLFVIHVEAQFATSVPGTIPLFQKTPHFGSWISAANGSLIANAAPFGWTGMDQNYLAYVRFRDRTWQWLGYRNSGGDIWNATTESVSISPTRTVLTVKAGPVTFNATFLTPIEPDNLVTQSFPFVYLSLEAWTTDSGKYDVDFYVEATAEFVRGVTSGPVAWKTTRTDDLVYHQMYDPNPVPLTEDKDTVRDGSLYFASSTSTPNLSYQAGLGDSLQRSFLADGVLSNDMQSDTRVFDDKTHPVVAFASTVSVASNPSPPIAFALGYLRDPVVRYAVDGGVQLRHSYFWTKYTTFEDALHAFVAGFANSTTNAIALDNRILNDANKVSSDYGNLVALSLRQTMGAIEITTVKNSDGNWNKDDVKIFMRDNGIGRRSNAVETVYAAFPTFLYLNPQLGRYLLEPLLNYQNSPVYRNNYAAPDLGSSYPDVLGNNTDSLLLAIENCGFMLTMSLAYAMKSGDGTLLHENYNILKTWGEYLVTYTMRADGYVSVDGLKSNGLTNMALGGIAGIYAMSKINEALEPQGMLGNYTKHFMNTATQYASDWQSRAFVDNHIASTYGEEGTWTLAHNLFAMKLIDAKYIKDEILNNHTAYLKDQLENSNYRYGILYDRTSGDMTSKTHWTFLAAASVTDPVVRESLITLLHRRPFSRSFSRDANPTTYSGIDGGAASGAASAAQGAAFALLALDIPNQQIVVPVIRVDLDRAAVAGGIVGGIVGVLLVAWAVYLYLRRRRKLKEDLMDAKLTKESRPGSPPNMDETGTIFPYLGITPDVENASGTSKRPLSSIPSPGGEHYGSSSPTSPFSPVSKAQMAAAEASSSRREAYAPRSNTLTTLSIPSEAGTSLSPSSQYQPIPAVPGDLMMEVEVLRRELEELRSQRNMHDEAPPMYFDAAPPPLSPIGTSPPPNPIS